MFFYHLIMQMIPGTYPGASHEPDHLPLFHLRTFPGVNECQVCVSGLKSETVRNDYRFPISGRFTCGTKLGGGVAVRPIPPRHIQACVKLPFTAYRMRPVAVTVGYPVFLFQGCDRGDETVNIPVLLDDPPHRGDVPVIPCGLQHLHDQRTFVLRPHPADRDQRKDRKAKYPPHSRWTAYPCLYRSIRLISFSYAYFRIAEIGT